MVLRRLIEMMPDVWAAYRPWLPVRTVRDYLTTVGRPDEALLGGGHGVAIAYVAVSAVVLLGVRAAVAHRRAARATIRRNAGHGPTSHPLDRRPDPLADGGWAGQLTDADRRGLTPAVLDPRRPYGEVKLDMSNRLVLGAPTPAR